MRFDQISEWLNRIAAVGSETDQRMVAEILGRLWVLPVHACSECGGQGVIMDPGYYVPGEQFVEPPSEQRCENCVGTGSGEVAGVIAALEYQRDEALEAYNNRDDVDSVELRSMADKWLRRSRSVSPLLSRAERETWAGAAAELKGVCGPAPFQPDDAE